MDTLAVTAVTSAVDFAPIIVGTGVIFAAVAVVSVAILGGRKLLSVLRS